MKQKRYLIDSLIISALIAIIVYIVVRATLFLFAEYILIEKVFAILLMLGEFFIVIHGLGYALNILRATQKKEPEEPIGALALGEKPPVAILVAARHEPRTVLENTFITLNNLEYDNKKVYFLDDSSDEKYMKEAEELAKAYDLTLFRRKDRHGAKSGIINDCLKTLTQKYIAIFDADQNPMPNFLKSLIPIMEKDERLAFVQTPQFYTNIEKSRVARGSAFQQAVFYEYICEGKNTSGSMFCCGTNMVLRREALEEAGGLDESTVTEDFATSIKLHALGWKSLYYNHTYAFGMGPENLLGYFKQQFRWATGTIAVFKKLVLRLLTKPFSLSPVQWWEYILSSSYYLVGLAIFIIVICPSTYLLFKIPSFFARPEIYFLAFIPYILLSMSVFYGVLRTRGYEMKDLFLGQLLGVSAFSVYVRGAFSALIGVKVTFGITEKTEAEALPYIKLWPQLAMIFLTFISLVWGLNRYIYERESAILVNSFWMLYHCAVFCGIFYLNKGKKE